MRLGKYRGDDVEQFDAGISLELMDQVVDLTADFSDWVNRAVIQADAPGPAGGVRHAGHTWLYPNNGGGEKGRL